MRKILNQIVNEMDTSNLETAEHYDNMDAEDFNNMDDAEYEEYLDYLDSLEDAEHLKRARLGLHTKPKARLHRKHVKKVGHKVKAHVNPLKGRAKLAAVGGGGSYSEPGSTSHSAPTYGSKAYINQLMANSKGDLNITVTRETSDLTGKYLPYILFGLNGYNSSYISTIKQYLPAGITMVASTDAATGDVLLTYTDGTDTDIIRISLTGSQISYSEFLQSMNSNFFKSMYIRQEYQNNSNLLLSVSQTINFGLLSALGMKNANNLLPRSRRLNDDYQTFIINLFLPEQKITSDFSFVQNAIPDTNPVVIAWDVFMSDRTDLNTKALALK